MAMDLSHLINEIDSLALATANMDNGLLIQLPVFALRFTHTIQLTVVCISGIVIQCIKHLTICNMGKLMQLIYSLSNRRLTVLRMLHWIHLDKKIMATCRINSLNTGNFKAKFKRAFTTKNLGLGIDPKATPKTLNSKALHNNLPVFNHGKAAYDMVCQLLKGSPYEDLLPHIHLRRSLNQAYSDGSAESLTISLGSHEKDDGGGGGFVPTTVGLASKHLKKKNSDIVAETKIPRRNLSNLQQNQAQSQPQIVPPVMAPVVPAAHLISPPPPKHHLESCFLNIYL